MRSSLQAILEINLVATAYLLERFGAVIAPGGAGVMVSSIAAAMVSFPAELELALATTPTAELLAIPEVAALTDPSDTYFLSKRANLLRVRAASVAWGARGARVNSVSPGVVMTQMTHDELDGPAAGNLHHMVEVSAAKRMGTPEDVAAAVAFLLSDDASFITGADLLVDGGAAAFYSTQVAAAASAEPA
jgi:NAD(P)-dependent dehydrogenase (short-subunit alcohol dehydrogenase family)